MKGNFQKEFFLNSPTFKIGQNDKTNMLFANKNKSLFDMENSENSGIDKKFNSPNSLVFPLQTSNINNLLFHSPQMKFGKHEFDKQENLRQVVSNEKLNLTPYLSSFENQISKKENLEYETKFASKEIIKEEKNSFRLIQDMLEPQSNNPFSHIFKTSNKIGVTDPVPPKLISMSKKSNLQTRKEIVSPVETSRFPEDDYFYQISQKVEKPLISVKDYRFDKKEILSINEQMAEAGNNSKSISLSENENNCSKNMVVKVWENYYDESAKEEENKEFKNTSHDDVAFSDIPRSHSNTINAESLDITLMNLKKNENEGGFSFCEFESNIGHLKTQLEMPFKESYDTLLKSYKELKSQLIETQNSLQQEKDKNSAKQKEKENSSSESMKQEIETLKKEVKTLLKTREFESLAFNEKFYNSETERKKLEQEIEKFKKSQNEILGFQNQATSLQNKILDLEKILNCTKNILKNDLNASFAKYQTKFVNFRKDILNNYQINDQINKIFSNVDKSNSFLKILSESLKDRIHIESLLKSKFQEYKTKAIQKIFDIKKKSKILKEENLKQLISLNEENTKLKEKISDQINYQNHQLNELSFMKTKVSQSEQASSILISELKSENFKLQSELQSKNLELKDIAYKLTNRSKEKSENEAVTLSRVSFLETRIANLQFELSKAQENAKEMLATQLARNAESLKFTVEEEKKRIQSSFEKEKNDLLSSFEVKLVAFQNQALKEKESLETQTGFLKRELDSVLLLKENLLQEITVLKNEHVSVEERQKEIFTQKIKELTEASLYKCEKLENEKKELRTICDEKQREISQLQRDISLEKGKKIANQLTQQNEDFLKSQETIQKLEHCCKNLEEQNKELSEKVELERQKFISFETRFKLLKDENSNLREAYSKSQIQKTDHDTATKRISQLEREKQDLESELQKYSATILEGGFKIEVLNKELSASVKEVSRLNSCVSKLENDRERKEKELNHGNDELLKQKEKIEKLISKRKSLKKEYEEKMIQFSKEILEVKNIALKNNSLFETLSETTKLFEQEFKKIESIHGNVVIRDFPQFEINNSTHSERIQKFGQEIKQTLLAFEGIATHFEKLKTENVENCKFFAQTHEVLTKEISALKHQAHEQSKEIVLLGKRNKEQELNLQNANLEINSLTATLENLATSSSNQSKQILELQSEVKQLEKLNNELEELNESLNSQIQQIESECDQLKEDFPIILRKEVDKGIFAFKKNELLGLSLNNVVKEHQSPTSLRKPTDDLSHWNIDWNRKLKKDSIDSFDIRSVIRDEKSIQKIPRDSKKNLDKLGWNNEALNMKKPNVEKKKNQFDELVDKFFHKRMNLKL